MKRHAIFSLAVLAVLLFPISAFASTGTAMAPWDSGLISFIASIQNDTKLLAGLGIIIGGGMAVIKGEHGGLMRTVGGVIAGLCAVTFGATYIPGLWGVAF
ncbi:MAG: hypothetical protein D084_Lepto4C00187G0003 [Leptospirillum sp. Group IV 'UBA BS']|jgi:hypothetical protein|nr:MAG: hypothetical protein D084_Lepto4C00187G0003 [Leptospirillum sp. Group IV 'UBA BS']